MARPLRIEYEGAVYHVTSRGNARKKIFRDDGDRMVFLEVLGSGYAWLFGTGHEIEGMLNGQPMDEMLMDLHNNSQGRQAGRNALPIDPNDLWTLPLNPNGPTYDNNYSKGCH